jgi:thiamine biosynthesis lipoprotein ApbE
MQADALATVLMVMPPAEALALADRMGVRAMLISHSETKYQVQRSASWHGN